MKKAKEVKRMEADKRQALHDVLSPKKKLDKLNDWGFRASKERAKLGFPEIPKNCVR